MLRQPFSQLPDDVGYADSFPISNWERLFDGLDLQLSAALKYACGEGVIAGGTIQTDKTVTPIECVTGGGAQGTWYGKTTANTDLSALLTNSLENVVWVCLVRMPTTGADAWPGYSSTFNAGTLQFKVQPTAPPNSFKLGSITLDGAGAVTAVDNSPIERPEIYAPSFRPWTGSVTFTPAGADAEWVECDHSADIQFAVPGQVTYWNPKAGGFEVGPIANGEPGGVWLLVTPPASGDPYYGSASVRLYVTRIGIQQK